VEHAHEMPTQAKKLKQFLCVLLNKFIADAIIAKPLPSCRDVAISLKHKEK
jgi:hypothetical protein